MGIFNRWVFRRWAIFFYSAMLVTYFVLLALKMDDHLGLTHVLIFIFDAPGHFIFGMALSISAVLHEGNARIHDTAATILIIGSLVTQMLIVLKADAIVSMTYLETLIPFLATVIVAGITLLLLVERPRTVGQKLRALKR